MTEDMESPEAFISASLRPDLFALLAEIPAPDPDLTATELLELLLAHHGPSMTDLLGPRDTSVELTAGGSLVRSPDSASIQLDGESVVLDLATGKAFGLNAVGTTMWDLLATPVTLPSVAAAVSATYAVPYERAQQDVARLLTSLQQRGLIVFASEQTSAQADPGT